MDFQWIILALLLSSMLMGAVKAIWGSFFENLIKLACIPVTFLVAWIIQAEGGFQRIADTCVDPLIKLLMGDSTTQSTLISFIRAIASSMVAAIIFTLAFFLLLVIIRFIAKKIFLKKKSENEKFKEKEAAPKKLASFVIGAIGGFLVFAIYLMPVFYTMDIIDSAFPTVREEKCDDSRVYNVLELVDNEIIAPYENGMVMKAYNYTGISSLMSKTASLGSKMTTSSGEEVYAADSLKTLISAGTDVLITVESKKATGARLSEDLKNVFSDDVICDVLADFAASSLESMEVDEEKVHTSMLTAITSVLKEHYEDAEQKQLSSDIHVLGEALVCLNDYDHLLPLLNGQSAALELAEVVEDQKCLEDVVQTLTDLSPYDALLETVYAFEIESICEMLGIPHDDKEAYDTLVGNLTEDLNAIQTGSINLYEVTYFADKFATSGKSLETIFEDGGSTIDKELYNNWNKYQKAWRSVQDAFSAACEDTSMGAIWIEHNGNKYFYDGTDHVWTKDDVVDERYSPVAELCQYLVTKAVDRNGKVTESVLIGWLEAFDSDCSDCSALAQKIINKDSFKSSAVTYEKMLSSSDFKSWDEESRRNDSKLLVQIIIDLKEITKVASGNGDSDKEYVKSLMNYIGTLGEAMDLMYETTCVKELPLQISEGMLQNDMFRKYINAGVIRQLNDAVKDHENMTYTSFMHSIKGVVSLVIDKIEDFGGTIQ